MLTQRAWNLSWRRERSPQSGLSSPAGQGKHSARFATLTEPTDFMERVLLEIGLSIVLLLGSHPNHRNGRIRRWQRDNAERITLAYIPIRSLRCLPAECWPFGGIGVC